MENLVKEFNGEFMKGTNANIRMLDVVSEVGELAKEVIKSQEYGEKEFAVTEDLEMEFGDVMYSLITFAHENNINVTKAVEKVILKYRARFSKKGHMGSN